MSPVTASVVGIPSKTTWSSTATIKLDGVELWLACGFSGSETAPHEGRRFIKFLENSEDHDFAKLYQNIQSFVSGLSEENAVSFSCVLRKGKDLLILTQGFGTLAFVRAGQVRWLADGKKDAIVLQGELRDGDFLLLSTARAHEVMPAEALLKQTDPDTLTAVLFSKVQHHEASGEIAFLFVKHQESSRKSAVAEKQHEEAPTQSLIAPKHLIAPSKLEEGILASSEEQKVAVEKGKKLGFWEIWRKNSLKNIHWIRAFLVIGVLISAIVGLLVYRTMSVQSERLRVLFPLEVMAEQVKNYDETQKVKQREEAQSLLERLKTTKITYNTNRRRLEQLTLEVESFYNSISGEKSFVNLPVYYDFRLVQAEFLASRGVREKEQSVYLDSSSTGLMRLDLTQKKHEKLPVEGLVAPRDLTLNSGTTYILDGKSIRSLALNAPKTELVAELNADGDYAFLESFASNLYILDRGKQQIWKLGTEKGASPSGWVRSARGVDFSSITSFTINGSVWLGSSNGEIYRLTRGERESFAPQGLPDPFTSTLLLATNLEGEKLAVVEPVKQRLVILDKNGEYKMQVISEQIGAVTDVYLSEDERSVYLVAGSIIYQVEIQ
jgi:hypothetical protein